MRIVAGRQNLSEEDQRELEAFLHFQEGIGLGNIQ
jgi:hypothetical protein